MNKTEMMKKLSLIILMVAITIASTAYAEENTGAETATASIGDVAFSLTNEQAYFDVLYKYPDEFELEIKEDGDRVRNIHRYHVEGYDPTAVGLVVSRTSDYESPEARVGDPAFIDDVTTEEINGVIWAIGTAADGSVIIYACAAGEYVYTFSFSTDFPADFDYADFARVFAQGVTIRNE